MTRLRILVDLDEVVYAWNGFLDASMEDFPCMVGVARLPRRTRWDLFEGLNEEQRMAMRWILNDPHYYAKLKVLPGAKEAIARLEAAGHDVYFVSTVFASSEHCASDKLKSVERDFGQHLRRRTILTDDKTLVMGDILIDDRPTLEGEATPVWRRIIFDQPYNQGIPGVRLKGWAPEDVDRAILEAVIGR